MPEGLAGPAPKITAWSAGGPLDGRQAATPWSTRALSVGWLVLASVRAVASDLAAKTRTMAREALGGHSR